MIYVLAVVLGAVVACLLLIGMAAFAFGYMEEMRRWKRSR